MAPRALTSYADSMQLVRQVQRRELANPKLNPACHSVFFEPGHPTRRAIVFMHGITSSPLQFRTLGELFWNRGYSVVIPRMPRHGYLDRLTSDQARLTQAEYLAFATEAIELGRGLGEHLTVVGLSVSGVLAAWCGQFRFDVDLSVLIAPAFAPFGVPLALVPALNRVGRALPNLFVWWDPRKRERLGPACGYPRFSTHAVVESMRVGVDVYRAARRQPPAAGAVLSVTHEGDRAVNNTATHQVVDRWQRRGAAVHEYAFGHELGALHDIVAPYQEHARVDYVHPILFNLIDGLAPSESPRS